MNVSVMGSDSPYFGRRIVFDENMMNFACSEFAATLSPPAMPSRLSVKNFSNETDFQCSFEYSQNSALDH